MKKIKSTVLDSSYCSQAAMQYFLETFSETHHCQEKIRPRGCQNTKPGKPRDADKAFEYLVFGGGIIDEEFIPWKGRLL
jgi:hypothetical protein